MFRRPPISPRTYTLCPYTTLFRSDQFRPWRDLHDRRLHFADLVPHPRLDRRDMDTARAAHRADFGNVVHVDLRLGGRAPRIPPASRVVPAGAADFRDRHVDLPAELRKYYQRGTGKASAARRHRELAEAWVGQECGWRR